MRFVCLAAGLILPLCALADKADDQSVAIESEDQEMVAAIQKAQDTLNEFLKIADHPPVGTSGFKVKVRITDVHGTEHMWVTPFRHTKTTFVGTLADKPDYVTNVTEGQELKFTRADISDWGYVQDGKQKGSFTVCVMFKHMPAAEVQKYRDDYGFEC